MQAAEGLLGDRSDGLPLGEAVYRALRELLRTASTSPATGCAKRRLRPVCR